MNWHSILIGRLFLLALTLAACSPAAAPAARVERAEPPAAVNQPAAAPAPVSQATETRVAKPNGNLAFKIGYSTDMQFVYLPIVITAERLNQAGWQIEHAFFAQTEVNTEAVAKNAVQLAFSASFSALQATQQGTRIPMVMEPVINAWTLVSRRELNTCEDLNGKRVAHHSEGAVNTAMVKTWVASTCRGTPNFMVIASSPGRANALMSGQIDATTLYLSDWIRVDLEQPGRFHVLKYFSEGVPDLSADMVIGNEDWLEKNRDVAVAFLAELLTTHRMLATNPRMLEEAGQRLVPELDANVLSQMIKAYQDITAFPKNGGLTPAKAAGTIRFFTDAGLLKPGLTIEQVSNLGPLNDALAIVGSVPGAQ
jgi:ABC-type nitrate/sulfonate/bicarbonate transport system substrate-binding protein